ncbi:OLC1v1015985C1 [Oldenlandia corymbosa var. corymbosa]|uniref:OLC1v1015985C1 n=1 Tax=Oldenlandia corymbosa var. corymbosa TaxID=529605 RepID=A0AAV1E4F7_OLDCO|nr:OLC1v1015985C1 [Oldenlandia corymbosa var. corymbosa]
MSNQQLEDGRLSKEFDVQNLEVAGRKMALERLMMKNGHDDPDADNFLLKLKQRIQRVGIELPTIEVRFQNLNVEAEAYLGSRAMPNIFNFYMNAFEGFLNSLGIISNKKIPFPVLREVNGIVRPGRLTLLLGPPASGKTTLLLALAGRLPSDLKSIDFNKLTYNGYETSEFVSQRSSAYVSQHDLHMGELTVRETLAFSARCLGVGAFHDMLVELLRREKEAHIDPDPDVDLIMKGIAFKGQETNVLVDYVIKILGLEACADTLVGDQMIRGISGGEKKRLTTGELMVGPARVLLMDEISTGLDSSTTFQIVNSIQQSVHVLQKTAVISLLQSAPETYELFDDLILLSEGHIVYQGPRGNVVEFFESMGFKCPDRKAVADFLQEVTSKKDQEQYWTGTDDDQPYSFVSPKQFAKAFQSSHIGENVSSELSICFDKSKSHPSALTNESYGVSQKEALRACFSREFLLLKRNSIIYAFRLSNVMIIAAIAMSIFPKSKMHKESLSDGLLFMAPLFLTVVMIMFNGFAELPLSLVKLPVFYKQRDLLFFPAWAYALPIWILTIPYAILEAGVWLGITYYPIGLDPDVGRFFRQYLLLIFINQSASGLFRLMAAVGRELTTANVYGSYALVIVLVLGGFILPYGDINKWSIWGYWISPLMYAQNAISVNEFFGQSWSHIYNGSTMPLGVLVLKNRSLFTHASWYWIGTISLIGFTILFNVLYTIALTFLKPPKQAQRALSTGEAIDLSSTSKGSVQSFDKNEVDRKRGMVLPFAPLVLTFDDIRYAIKMPQEMKAQGFMDDRLELLKGVSGSFRPGVLTALMGVSGAGKTTLLDVLAGRKTGGYIEGTIMVSGYPKKQETFARVAGYCEQNDIHSPHLTVYESLRYSAWLRLHAEVDVATRELVELTMIKEAIVGLPGVNGLSTEQRKRVTIAVELVANPSIIFMDEPTTGLDARAAAIVMRTVRNTVDTGRTVVCTIHQPSVDIFDAFDELVLLKIGGDQMYGGPLGRHCSELIKYFEGINGVQKFIIGRNPATWVMEVSSIAQEEALGVDFAAIYRSSKEYRVALYWASFPSWYLHDPYMNIDGS